MSMGKKGTYRTVDDDYSDFNPRRVNEEIRSLLRVSVSLMQ